MSLFVMSYVDNASPLPPPLFKFHALFLRCFVLFFVQLVWSVGSKLRTAAAQPDCAQ